MFSRSCEYALQAIIYIALHSGKDKYVGLKEISESQQVPHHFLSKILQTLVKHKVLISVKGPTGGFGLNRSAKKITLLQVVEIIDGTDIFDRCGLGLKKCSDKTPCPIHAEYKIVKKKIRELLSNKTLQELCQDVEKGEAIVNFK